MFKHLEYIACYECHLDLVVLYQMPLRADSRFVPSQWETTLLCNDISHWLGASLKSGLLHLLASSDCFRSNTHKARNIQVRGAFQKGSWALKSNFHLWIKCTSFNAWVRYFVWNFKGDLWNSTQNMWLIHWKMWFLYNVEILRAPLRIIYLAEKHIDILVVNYGVSMQATYNLHIIYTYSFNPFMTSPHLHTWGPQ